jgi:hypothetical protein
MAQAKPLERSAESLSTKCSVPHWRQVQPAPLARELPGRLGLTAELQPKVARSFAA